jgi:hypothetical protein
LDVVLDSAALLMVYDSQLRDEAEVSSALTWQRHGPLIWATYPAGRGFVTYRELPADAAAVTVLVTATINHFSVNPHTSAVEWKTRGHDRVFDLPAILRAHGFVAGDVESVMMGEARSLAADVPLPAGVTVRRVCSEADVRRMCAMQAEVFDSDPEDDNTEAILHQLALGQNDLELWVAEAGGMIVCAGRLEPIPGTVVAGIWGGCTRAEWRGRGIYRALTAERARSALRRGCSILHSDSTQSSRPILQRSGFVKATTTTPYTWRRSRRRKPA